MRITGSSTARSPAKVRDAHSLYVETLAELGPIGLALLSAALVVPLVAAVRARRHPLSVPADSVALVDPRRLLARVARGDLANVSFSDMRRLVEAFGFDLRRTSGATTSSSTRTSASSSTCRRFAVRRSRTKLVERDALTMADEQ
ncbi:MAG TPA: hypothetical protein VEL10_01935 [Gaiellaceae bacterium]|nr:hypothetical protein [Gaiellaceae bacterium]